MMFLVKHCAVNFCMDFCTLLSRISLNQEYSMNRTNTVLSLKKPVEIKWFPSQFTDAIFLY